MTVLMSLKLNPGFRGRGASFAFADSSPSKIDKRLVALAKSKLGSIVKPAKKKKGGEKSEDGRRGQKTRGQGAKRAPVKPGTRGSKKKIISINNKNKNKNKNKKKKI